ncbi:MAG: sugar ABC transporter permease [Ktedonobacteraceae bacterium]
MKSSSIVSSAETLTSAAEKQRAVGRVRQKSFRTSLIFWSFVGPLVLGLLIFVYVPIVWSIILSFYNARATITPSEFIGLQNYQAMLEDKSFTGSLLTFTIFTLFIVPTTLAGALGLALLVNGVRVARGFFRSVFFLPTACSYVVASLVWKMSVFAGLPYGLVNSVTALFGVAPISWVSSTSPPWYWLVLVTVRLWLQLGIFMIIFIAGLQEIPRELYEASFVDGAKRGWTTFRYITLPLLRNTSIAVLLLCIIYGFQAFDEFFNIMTGGNQILARPPLVYLYTVALSSQDYGRGSAGAMILTLIIVVISLIQGRIFGFGKAD